MAASNMDTLMAKLFRWKTSIDIEGVTFYIRIVSDQVIDDARKYALLGSRNLRRDLRNVNSDDYLIYLDPLADLDADQLRTLNTSIAMREIMRDYLNNNPRPQLDPLPTNPSQEMQEEHEAARLQREDDYIKGMTEYVENWREDYQEALAARDYDYLLNMARKNRVDQVCEEKFSSMFEEYVVCESVFTDKNYKEKMFTLDQFRELPNDVRVKLRDAYNNISIAPDQVKN